MNTADSQPISWQFHAFDTLDTKTLFAVLKLRVDVFVVEQACAYPELDAHDTAPDTLHLLGYSGPQLVAYARAMPSDPCVTIGRVVVTRSLRGTGAAQGLMHTLLHRLEHDFPGRNLNLAAQDAVASFYTALGFKRISEIYLEDGIAHVDMQRAAQPIISSPLPAQT